MKYEIPGLGRLRVVRDGEYGGPDRYRWRFRAECADGREVSTWGTAPADWDTNAVFGLACDVIGHKLMMSTEGRPDNGWTLYGDGVQEGTEHAATYATTALFWRVQPYSYAPDGDTYPNLSEVMSDWTSGFIGSGHPNPGDVLDVYRNNDDEPWTRLVVGPRGGIRRESW